MKEGLRRLLASGATSRDDAEQLIDRIRRISTSGTRIEVETMKVWPDNDPKARPASEFFVNERIDLLVREAETFRNDYREQGPADRFPRVEKTDPVHEAGRPAAPPGITWRRTTRSKPRNTAASFCGDHRRLRGHLHAHHFPAEPANALRVDRKKKEQDRAFRHQPSSNDSQLSPGGAATSDSASITATTDAGASESGTTAPSTRQP